MNIKSLLFGSAAALIAVSGACAADAVVVAEPEPAEYVKICDVYGAGYFYIPGTETCLRIGGYVRYDVGVGDAGSFDGVNHVPDSMGEDDHSTYWKNARFNLKTWTGQETELGTLKTYTETRFNFGNSFGDYANQATTNDSRNNWQARNTGITLNFAWIQLGGLRVGKDDPAFDTFIGYAGNVINDTIVPYGGFDSNVVQYYFDLGNGLSGVVSLEEGSGSAGPTGVPPFTYISSGYDTIDSYVPHVVGGVKYTQGWGAITGVAAYDSTFEEYAGKVRLDVNASSALSLFLMAGYGTDKNIDRNFYKQWGGNWTVWGGGTYKFNEKTSFNLQVSADDDKNYGVAANLAYDVVPGFTVTAEVDYNHDGKFGQIDNRNWVGATKENSVGGLLRFQRDF
ncbi:porin [Mesorhizobium sp. M7A.F.Ca.CA.001.09.2.1]|uniref:Porin n=11 Tax=Mesorhizobium TaxID=68287 RepID=A0AB38TGB0_9HYPH|nr:MULTISPECIES: porin [Mesorhizobium]MDF3218159.1 porin [Mesorhizobium ciceri]RUY61870.1 porin [Mesorhizobium sp. M7A.F.Ca.CA.001.09.2.1]RUZ04715.1 porin [Mesorhizobium sp. M7A.F.Ca.CA.001.04.2.1]RUZ42888.1 porin [Mesorhizobium sp. M7A.F.Ca.CA.001.15.1.1]RUZ79952.1 porin [Mesorhizobium sp. M7A.F.Ca.CA.001.14.1.1]